jgi:acyl carrier protein phosphodiesterase
MNILAHGYLSEMTSQGRNSGILLGNFAGDFIKGNPAHPRHALLPDELIGIKLHRAIDAFTDTHPDVALVKDLLRPRCHKYAGVAVDVFFDHFLAVRFTQLTGESLGVFVAYFQKTLLNNADRLPESASRMLAAMIRYDWLTHYQNADGIDKSLKGLARRTAFPSGLDTAIDDFTAYYQTIGDAFARFWPELVVEVKQIGDNFIQREL